MNNYFKRLLLIYLCTIASLSAFAQLAGTFNYGQDGHIYFNLINRTNRFVPITWAVNNAYTKEQRTGNIKIYPNYSFVFGLNENWAWQRGETFTIRYSNGQTVTWTCPETDPIIAQQQGQQYNNRPITPQRNNNAYNNVNQYQNGYNNISPVSKEMCYFCKGNVICGICHGSGGTRNSIGFYPCGACNATGICKRCNGQGYNVVTRQFNNDGSLDVYRSDGGYSHTDQTGTIGYTGQGKMYIHNSGEKGGSTGNDNGIDFATAEAICANWYGTCAALASYKYNNGDLKMGSVNISKQEAIREFHKAQNELRKYRKSSPYLNYNVSW